VDIGCGGGRWTRYLLGFKTVYAVDYYEQLLLEFRKTFNRYKHIRPIKNNGTDFPGVAPQSVDYVFSFGCFGHINQTLIDGYLAQIKEILKRGGNVVIHYSDKNKAMAQDPGFSDNTPEQMRALVLSHGFTSFRKTRPLCGTARSSTSRLTKEKLPPCKNISSFQDIGEIEKRAHKVALVHSRWTA
jgi:cyclopropane fatty-acyl-phospholipid synthase-like methyltransferase